jgi:hypothetical protein
MRGVRLRNGRPAPAARLVFRWDLDKTYLKSEFETLREMVRIPFEKAEDKVAAPGVAALIRGLRETALSRGRSLRVYFVSASPPQIGRAIRRKLELDGIIYDGIVFKNQLQRLMRGKFRHLREHIGYKLTELLKARRGEPATAREYLFGDDWESDPLIYSLYADIVAHRVGGAELEAVLRAARVDSPLIAESCTLAAAIEPADAVARIFINLERRTPPARLRAYGARLVPAFNYLQTAACLYEDDVLDVTGFVRVARSLREESAYTAERVANSLSDIERRGHLRASSTATLRAALRAAELLPAAPPPTLVARWRQWRTRRRERRATVAPEPALIDYRAAVGMEIPADAASE